MAGRQPESLRGPFVCEYCGQEWPSARALGGHMKAHAAHIKGKAPAEAPFTSVPPAPAFGPGPRMMPPIIPPSFFRLPPPAMGLRRQPAAPAGLLIGGLLPRRPLLQVRQPLRDPVVYDGAGGVIRMVLLEPNHGFWALYRMGMEPPEEIDFMELRPRPASPSPSFSSWLDDDDA